MDISNAATPENEIDPRTAARPLPRLKPPSTVGTSVPHSWVTAALQAIALLSIVSGAALLLMGLGDRRGTTLGVGVQGMIAGVVIFAMAIVVYRVEEIAYWSRKSAEHLERNRR